MGAAPIIAIIMSFHARLEGRGVLELTGPDSRQFLQGQATCDLDQLRAGKALPGACCTPQGRMYCDFRLIARNETDCLLSMQRDICRNSASLLGKYIVFSKAELGIASDDWVVFAAWGEGVAGQLATTLASPDWLWVQVDDAGQRFECHCPAARAEDLQRQLRQCSQEVNEAAWQLEEIEAGLGHIEAATVEQFLPQMLNYQVTGQVSFSKGCYTGQEVVARLHYRGKLKRAMYLADAETGPAQPGTPLFAAHGAQSVGNVVNAAPRAGGSRLLAVCTIAAAQGEVRLAAPDGAALHFLPLPYALPELE